MTTVGTFLTTRTQFQVETHAPPFPSQPTVVEFTPTCNVEEHVDLQGYDLASLNADQPCHCCSVCRHTNGMSVSRSVDEIAL